MKKITNSHSYIVALGVLYNVISQILNFFCEIADLICCIPSPTRVPLIAIIVISIGSFVSRLF